jgi:hypothetical protein
MLETLTTRAAPCCRRRAGYSGSRGGQQSSRAHDRLGSVGNTPPELRGALGAALQDAGYAVEVVATAADAEARLADRRYDLLIADWRISMATSGYVIFTPPSKATRHELLTKPIQAAKLVEVLERLLGKTGDGR